MIEPKRVPDRDDQLAGPQPRRSSELDDGQGIGADAEQCEVGVGIVAEHVGLVAAAVGGGDIEMLRA